MSSSTYLYRPERTSFHLPASPHNPHYKAGDRVRVHGVPQFDTDIGTIVDVQGATYVVSTAYSGTAQVGSGNLSLATSQPRPEAIEA